MGYGPWGRKESDMTEHLSIAWHAENSFRFQGQRQEALGVPFNWGKNVHKRLYICVLREEKYVPNSLVTRV